jgi:hypothetical protein
MEIPATVAAPPADTMHVGLQQFAVINSNDATEGFEVFGRVTNTG